MDFIKFHGHKKTSNEFLKQIKEISNNTATIMENLASLKIFDTITLDKKKLFLEESPNTARINVNSSGKKIFSFKFPNIFGSGESLSLNFKNIKDYNAEFMKPIVANGNLYKTAISVSNSSKNINDKNIQVLKSELSVKRKSSSIISGAEKLQNLTIFYAGLETKLFGFDLITKTGMTKYEANEPFLKAIISKSINLASENFFFNSSFSMGRIFGKTPLTEKFFLGSKTRGYKPMSISPVSQNKKVGGNAFIELRNKAGFCIRNIQTFLFADFSVNSYRGIRECADMAYKLEDTGCIGRSVGVGIALKNRPGVSFIYSIPLTTNAEVEKYSFSVDMEF